MPYASLALAKTEIVTQAGGTLAARPDDDAALLRALYFVSERIEKSKGYSFEPRIKTEYYDALGFHIDDSDGRLYLREPLLAVTSLTVGGVALTADEYVLQPRGRTPYTSIRRIDGNWYATEWQDAIAITGVWGWRERYATDGWLKVDDLAAGITSSATTLTVADVDGVDAFGRTPRISAGNLLRIVTGSDTEYLEVTATNTSTNVVSCRRGVNGSTAVAHSTGDDVEVWQPEDNVVRAAVRWAGYLMARRGAFARIEYDGLTAVTFPPDMPDDVKGFLSSYPPFDQWGTP